MKFFHSALAVIFLLSLLLPFGECHRGDAGKKRRVVRKHLPKAPGVGVAAGGLKGRGAAVPTTLRRQHQNQPLQAAPVAPGPAKVIVLAVVVAVLLVALITAITLLLMTHVKKQRSLEAQLVAQPKPSVKAPVEIVVAPTPTVQIAISSGGDGKTKKASLWTDFISYLSILGNVIFYTIWNYPILSSIVIIFSVLSVLNPNMAKAFMSIVVAIFAFLVIKEVIAILFTYAVILIALLVARAVLYCMIKGENASQTTLVCAKLYNLLAQVFFFPFIFLYNLVMSRPLLETKGTWFVVEF